MSYTDKAALNHVLDALFKVRHSDDAIVDFSMGICDNVEGLLTDEYGYDTPGAYAWRVNCEKAFEQWDKFSGQHMYPVYDPVLTSTPAMQFTGHYKTGTLWEGIQGELRQDLLDHLIDYFTDRLEEIPA